MFEEKIKLIDILISMKKENVLTSRREIVLAYHYHHHAR